MKKNPLKEPLVSIITVVFNGKKYLQQTIESVINQSYKNSEYLIIDGGSTDGTLEIIKKYQSHISQWVSQNDEGIYDAMNKGIKMARGKYLLFLNAQDELVIDLNKLHPFFIQDYSLIYGNANVISLNESWIRGEEIESEQMLFDRMPTCHQAIFYRKKFMPDYDISYKIIADRVATYNVLKEYGSEKTKYVNQIICNYYLGGYSDRHSIRFAEEKYKFRKAMRTATLGSFLIYYLNTRFRYKYSFFKNLENSFLLSLYRKIKTKYTK